MSRIRCSFSFVLVALTVLVGPGLVADQPSGSNVPKESVLVPPLPPSKSPIEVFRELLAQTPAERADFLSKRPPQTQKLIQAKLQEYEALPVDERELRLQVTELQLYLLPLMKTPATNRIDQLATIPARPRPLIEARLQQWDKLPPELQKQILENQDILRYYVELAAKSGKQIREQAQTISPAQREKLEAGIRQWQGMTEDQRQEVKNNFDRFFGLTPQEKQKTLHTLSDAERQQLEKTLQTFGNLTPMQRAECLRSFDKFASLTAQQRLEFLKSAQQWETMNPAERQSWKDLVFKLSRLPPLPQGLGFPPVPFGLRPAVDVPFQKAPVVATNHSN
jgi:hypothetical protein